MWRIAFILTEIVWPTVVQMVERLVCCYQYLSIQAELYVVISISLHTNRPLWIGTENCQVLVKLPFSWIVFIWIICQLLFLESHFLAAPILSDTPFTITAVVLRSDATSPATLLWFYLFIPLLLPIICWFCSLTFREEYWFQILEVHFGVVSK